MRRAEHPILLDPPVLLAAGWALLAHTLTRRRLRRRGLEASIPPAPPGLPGRGARGVSAVLTWRGATCLERSLVLQRWLMAHGSPADVLIGVAREGPAPGPPRAPSGWDLHAWIDGIDNDGDDHQVLHRLPPRRPAGALRG
jgi:hypothetical protein